MRGNTIYVLYEPATEVWIIPEYLMDTLVGKKPLTPTDKYFRSPFGLFFECRGIVRDVPIIVDKIEMCLDFHIFDIFDFNLLLGSPLEKLLTSYQGSLDEMLRENASATAIPCLENPLAKPLPEPNLLEEMMHPSPFVLFEPILLEVAKFSKECNS